MVDVLRDSGPAIARLIFVKGAQFLMEMVAVTCHLLVFSITDIKRVLVSPVVAT